MTGEGADLFGTFRHATGAVTVELGRLGIPGEPGPRAVRLRGDEGQEIVITDKATLVALAIRLRAGLRHLA